VITDVELPVVRASTTRDDDPRRDANLIEARRGRRGRADIADASRGLRGEPSIANPR
jgi:hypothetical protein